MGGHTSAMESSEGGALGERVKAVALALGFDRVGVARLGADAARPAFLREWLARGYAARWRTSRAASRSASIRARCFAGARSVVVVGLVYDPGERGARRAGGARVARYAGGDDYHDVLRERLRAVGDGARGARAGAPCAGAPTSTRGPCSSACSPRDAGLGWIGKNTLPDRPELGSYLFLGVLLTDLELAPDAREPDHCGSCRACLDACPTDAFPEPYVLDATRCLSYTTIELRGAIPEPLREAAGRLGLRLRRLPGGVPVEPRARRARAADPRGPARARSRRAPSGAAPTLAWLLALDEDAWRAATRRTALRRTKLPRPAAQRARRGGQLGRRVAASRCSRATPRATTRCSPSTRAGRSRGSQPIARGARLDAACAPPGAASQARGVAGRREPFQRLEHLEPAERAAAARPARAGTLDCAGPWPSSLCRSVKVS